MRSNQPLSTWPPYDVPDQWAAASFAATIPADAWRRLSCGEGVQGPRLYDWAYRPARPAERNDWAHGLPVRRHPERPDEVAFYLAYAPTATPLAELARAAGVRWAIDDMLKLTKGQVGLDHYEVRSWRSWYRHITLALLAFVAPCSLLVPSPSPRSAASSSISSGRPPAAERRRHRRLTPLASAPLVSRPGLPSPAPAETRIAEKGTVNTNAQQEAA